jgi:DNA-binding SARP family transcriptional activator
MYCAPWEWRNPTGTTAEDDAPFQLRVIGRFQLRVRQQDRAPGASAQRLLALTAINGGAVSRSSAAGLLWPDAPAGRAAANLRSALWRLHRQGAGEVIDDDGHQVRLRPGGAVDLWCVSAVARALMDTGVEMSQEQLSRALRCNLYEDLLPDWLEDEWLDAERERMRRWRLLALEALSARCLAAGWYGEAVDTALAALRADPYRESAHVVLIRAHLAEGNRREALQRYESWRRLYRVELGLEPSVRFEELFGPHSRPRGASAPSPFNGWSRARTPRPA